MKKNQVIALSDSTELTIAQANEIMPIEENQLVPVEENLPATKKDKKKLKAKQAEEVVTDEFSGFPDLAKLMNTTVLQLKDEFFLFQIRKLMSRMAKTVIRFGISDKEMEKLFFNAKALEMDEIVVAPAFLPACIKQVNKLGGEGFKVGAIVDFPFGESTVKSKIAGIKECVKAGVDDINVMMPSLLVTKENIKQFRKQSAKIGKLYKGFAGIALNATDLDEEQIKLAIKAVNKTKLAFLTFVFGTATLEEVNSKMSIVKKYKDDKKIFALANVDTAEGVMALFTNGVDKILTPYADEIGEELVKRFKIKSVKLK